MDIIEQINQRATENYNRMIAETRKVIIKGEVTNASWGESWQGRDPCEYIQGDDHETVSITEVLETFKGLKVKITIEQEE